MKTSSVLAALLLASCAPPERETLINPEPMEARDFQRACQAAGGDIIWRFANRKDYSEVICEQH